jgi:hypothetical protein
VGSNPTLSAISQATHQGGFFVRADEKYRNLTPLDDSIEPKSCHNAANNILNIKTILISKNPLAWHGLQP